MNTLPTVHFFETQPTLVELQNLPIGDLFINVGGDDALYWADGSFHLTLEPVIHNPELYEAQLSNFENFIAVDISGVEFEKEIVETPYAFNSESGNISYHTSFVAGNIDNFKYCDFEVDFDHSSDEEFPVEVAEFKKTINLFTNDKTIVEILGSTVESKLNEYADEHNDEITEYLKNNY